MHDAARSEAKAIDTGSLPGIVKSIIKIGPPRRTPDRFMYVCICRAVTLSHLRAIVASGAATLDDVEGACGAGGDCGTCRNDIRRVLAEAPPSREPQSKAA